MSNPNHKHYKYSVCILIFHRSEDLVEMAKKCLDSVLSTVDRNETEIIICDNGSTVRTDYWEKNVDTYIRLSKNMGISRGWNLMLKASRGQYKAILGDDTTVTPNWLPKMAECFQNASCGVANPYVEHLPVGLGIKEDYKWYSGACFMLTQETIDKVGYFREDLYFPTNFEDWDYWLRCYKAGLKLYKNFSVKVGHLEGQTTKAQDLDTAKKQTREAFLKEWGFDATSIFCGNQDMPFS